MTSTQDVQDMLGITPSSDPRPKPNKKLKQPSHRPSGFQRELHSLLGERAPPITLASGSQYKSRLNLSGKPVRKWRQTAFTNGARGDGLLLRHWRREHETVSALNPNDVQCEGQEENSAPPVQTSTFAKLNVQAEGPKYDDTEYELYLNNENWTKEETSYLVELYSTYYGKWPIIIDRYDYQPIKAEGEMVSPPKERIMEDLKARFYEVAAKMMAVRTPVTNMTTSEFEKHELMLKYDPEHERIRKEQAEALLKRSEEDRKEEQFLVGELKRIYNNQEKMLAESQDLRQRLDTSLTSDDRGAPRFESAAEIGQLFAKLVSQDKNKKRRATVDGAADTSLVNGSPVASNQQGRASDGGNVIQVQKRSSLGQASSSNVRNLSPQAEARFGVSTHERLPSGITFRSDKLAKLRAGKSATQTQKISALLAELEVPLDLQMPTSKVCGSMEKLISKINLLLDARKVREKEENEVLIAKQKRQLEDEVDGVKETTTSRRESHSQGGTHEQGDEEVAETANPNVADSGIDGAHGVANGEDATSPAGSSSVPTTRNKRSASVLSTSSGGTSKRRKV